MADHLPVEKNVFHPRSGSDVVDNQVAIGHCRFLVHHNSDVRDSAAQAPGGQIAGLVIAWVGGKRQGRSVAAEKDHQIWYPAVIDVCVGTAGTNASRRYPLARVGRSMRQHVLADFLLQVNTGRPVRADHYLRNTDAILASLSISADVQHASRTKVQVSATG